MINQVFIMDYIFQFQVYPYQFYFYTHEFFLLFFLFYYLSYFLIFSICNGIASSILAIGILYIGEIVLNSATVFRLNELAQSTAPLMKILFNTAIGTYNHSIIVGNLAEAASLEIGANDL